MNEQIAISTSEHESFKDFLFKNQSNRNVLWMAAAAVVIQLSVFKYLYPYASFIHGDSFSYINAADKNLDINTYPIGYSLFLRLFSVFTKSDTALVVFQYLFIQASSLFLLFTIFYFYKPSKVTQYVLLAFMGFNPLFLHLGNLVSSDCIFAGLSLIWFGLILWIMYRPTTKIIIWHTVVLFIAFTVRYNAVIYPFIATIAIWLSSLPLRKKIVGITAGALLCGLFICYTSYKYKQLTGFWQFSPFSGWLMANNAMYSYRYVQKGNHKPVPKKFQVLDNMIREYFDTTRDVKKHPVEKIQASTFYMWSRGLPLVKYQNKLYPRKDSSVSEFKKWATMGPFYKSYGLYIIRQYPWHFLRYFIWPNANKYYAPPTEFMESYNSGKKHVTEQTKTWFGYKGTKVKTRMSNGKIWVLEFYPILSGIINAVMLLGLIYFILLKGWRKITSFNRIILMGSLMWLLNAVFTICVSSAALRFQSFPVLLTTTFAVLLVDWMIQLITNIKSQAEAVKSQEEKGLNVQLPHEAIA
jgi:hypothetical protein